MNPAKRKKLYRAALKEENKKISTPVTEEKKPETVVEKLMEKPAELSLGLKELPKEEPVTAAIEEPVAPATTTTKKKKV